MILNDIKIKKVTDEKGNKIIKLILSNREAKKIASELNYAVEEANDHEESFSVQFFLFENPGIKSIIVSVKPDKN